jgi:2-polyprenyl-3-methyl-5-hydroxy-6-metoxy-1,4-benzoquinol methylase
MIKRNLVAARRHGVESACHAEDLIYAFVVQRMSIFPSINSAVDYYFDDGARSAAKIGEIVAKLPLKRRPIEMLEFASGYGCVSRHLKKNPILSLTSCDIHEQAIEFLRTKLAVRSLMSAHAPEQLALGEEFDVVFALSFFSHMPRTTFGRWLKALFEQLRCPGYLIFTTHGLASRKNFNNPEIPADGFWFAAMSEQADLSTAEYGMTIVTPEFVTHEVLAQTGRPIYDYRHAYWWEHQDLWIVEKD